MGIFSWLFSRQPRTITADDAIAAPVRGAGYDATRGGNETVNLWKNATSLDADACNSLSVRIKLRNYSREERMNNGHCAGIISTHSNYIIGTGPKLRVQTKSPGFNSMVEARWKQWCKATRFTEKLQTLCSAKTGDGESVAVLVDNPGNGDLVSLDLKLIECDQLTAPVMRTDSANYVDGVHFDEFGTPTAYDILARHPGSVYYSAIGAEYRTYPASHVLHWFKTIRPGQHRGIPELTPSLSLFGTSRRFREAVVATAETAADIAAVMQMGMANEGNDEVAPFTTLPIEKRMLLVSPAGATVEQMRAEQPSTTYEMFVRQMICEEARPLNMPYNIAACDSSGYSYSGGQLDHQTYFVSIGVERQACEIEILNRVFIAWYEQARHVYGWRLDIPTPRPGWAWNKKPQNDPVKTASARKISLSFGGALLSDIFAEDGEDYADKVVQMADDYGVTVEELKKKLFVSVFPQRGGAPGEPESDGEDDDDNQSEPGNGKPANGRMTQYMKGLN